MSCREAMIYAMQMGAAMIGIRNAALALAALALVPGVAAAQGTVQHRFTVGGEAFTVPVPQGYCLPSGASVALAERSAALDSMNMTHADLERCGTFGEDYVHIKSPREALPIDIPRADFLALIAQELQTANGQQLVDDALDEAAREVADGTGNAVKLANTVPRFIGQDDMCVYMALRGDVVGESGSVKISGVICMTVIERQFMNINAYAVEGTGVTEAQLKTRVRTIATSIAPVGA